MYRGMLLGTWSRNQPTVTLSTAEAELTALTTAAQEGNFVVHVRDELNEEKEPVGLRVYTDSNAARAVVFRRGVGRMKHLAAKQRWVQEQLRSGRLALERVASVENIADLLTKAFTRARHEALCRAVGLKPWIDEELIE